MLLAFIIVVWWMLQPKEEPAVEGEETTQTLPKTTQTKTPSTVTSEEAPKVQEVSAGTVARTFVERMGSYSSESDYQNVDDVLGLVTANLETQLKKDAEKARAQTPQEDGGYYGISTSYVGAKTTKESEAQITLLVQTQREESFGSPGNSTVRYQQVEVTLVKENDTWKVDSYTWMD